jgi:hypothetical protein
MEPKIHCSLYSTLSLNIILGGCLWGYIQKFPNWVDNVIYAYNNKHLLRSNTKGYGGRTH